MANKESGVAGVVVWIVVGSLLLFALCFAGWKAFNLPVSNSFDSAQTTPA